MFVFKKLLAPIITGVLVAFLFIAMETLFLPEQIANSRPIPSPQFPAIHSVGNGFQAVPLTPEMTGSKQRDAGDTVVQSPRTSVRNAGDGVLHVPKKKLTADGESVGNNPGVVPKTPAINNSRKALAHTGVLQQPTTNKRLNKQTNNMNVLFIGVEKDKLLACSIFSINYSDQYQAGAVFLPTYATAPNYKYTFAQIYKKVGVEGLKQIIEKEMAIDIELYYKVERELLKQLESYIAPIYINGEKIELYNLFTMAVSPQDEEILGALVRELLKPGVFFTKLPWLLLDAAKYITTNFKITIQNLKFHYNNIVNLDSQNITKVVLPTEKRTVGGKTFRQISPYHMLNTIYEVTK
jgi:hypothetical protein